MFVASVSRRTVRLAAVTEAQGRVTLKDQARFDAADFDSFETILQRYFSRRRTEGALFFVAVAGLPVGSTVSSALLPWAIDGDSIRAHFSFDVVRLVNEHLATARGLFDLPPDALFTINDQPAVPGNIGLMAVDELLAEVLMVRRDNGYLSFLTNGGHTGLAPATQLEAELWQYLYAQRDVVEVGDVVSSAGLVRLVDFYLESHGHEVPEWLQNAPDPPSRIVETALAGKQQVAVDAVDLFVDCFAGEAANLALRGATTGGLYLAGRVTTELLPSLDQGRFLDNYLKRGAAEEKLRPIPIRVILDSAAPLRGVARMALEFEHPQ
ncbi:MAG TPA: glucokinase [candidate division Zixibacteria bacterium]|nr:glucokinase [candidate division Zixibacteria bacterium]MDD4916787.1 glucokinase [candidate division Zixibacteria bacterium]MDM7974155.1 glucokinase [candidate division Zixibacteria bacterium]HOD66126.1 glucokinase [candidate division Zixibacteria bacterium]HOZ07986.1 glucokinase [candidate division Zixibacteria bacterium]